VTVNALAVLVLALAAPPRPEWIDGMPAAFPRDRFVTATGAADERDAAEARARAGVAAFFESGVAASTRVAETESRAAAGGVELRVQTLAARQEVAAVTAKLLEGVEIADAWTDASSGRVHALAVLERGKAVAALRSRLAEIDAEVSGLGKRAAAEARRLERARLGHRTLSMAARRGPLLRDLAILDPAALPPAPADLPALRSAAERALSEVTVSVRATGDGAESVAAGASRAIVATGLRAVEAEAPHELSAALAVEAAPPALSGEWTTVRVTARLSVNGGDGEGTLVTFVESAKGTSGRVEEARRRAVQALSAAVEERLGAELRGRLEPR
jgi:LPP20 lipoprotein